MAGLASLIRRPFEALDDARGHLLPFAATALGLGIALWFQLPFEPARVHYLIALGLISFGSLGYWFGPHLGRPLFAALALLALGFAAAGLRAHSVAAPMLGFRYYGPVEGRVIEIDRSSSDAVRITLDRVVLEDVAPDRTPVKVRVSLQGDLVLHEARPGETIILTAHLSAPEGPVEPGGFDFRRMAYFEQLGAVGYTRNPVLLLEFPEAGDEVVSRLRTYLADGMRTHMDGDAGEFAVGAMTGDRSGISQETVAALRDSSLAHLLAISGMNLAFLVGFVFLLVRKGIALVPALALRVNAKKISAVLSLGVALFYLMLSGANVATERAFVMVAVMLGAVLLDRRAITLRTAAIAGLILLLMRPESLMAPGFQMSFAATVALVSGFAVLDHKVMLEKWSRWSVPVFTLVASSVIAGFATAPYAAATFNRFADFGLLANLLTVPVMGAVIMPAGAMAVLLAPFGLAGVALWAMETGARWILFVAYWIAGLEGAVTGIPEPSAVALPLITLGGIWLAAWPRRARLAGVVPVVLGLVLWPMDGRPDLLISSDGRLLGLLGEEGRALSKPKGGGFAAVNWLENDGDLSPQDAAAKRPGFAGKAGAKSFSVGPLTGIALSGKGAVDQVAEVCRTVDFVVVAAEVTSVPDGCTVLDEKRLAQTGALALRITDGQARVEATRAIPRLWVGKPMPTGALPVLTARDPSLVALQ